MTGIDVCGGMDSVDSNTIVKTGGLVSRSWRACSFDRRKRVIRRQTGLADQRGVEIEGADNLLEV